jgi:hypothetical protein
MIVPYTLFSDLAKEVQPPDKGMDCRLLAWLRPVSSRIKSYLPTS